MSVAISAIVPIHNSEEYLEKCLQSILNQTFRDFELILVDDGSLDKSSSICDEYSTKDSRIRVIHKKNEGVSCARNTGIKIATGEYITFVDSDDYIDSCFFEIAYNTIKKHNADIYVAATVFEFWENNNIKDKYFPKTTEGVFNIKYALEHWSENPREFYWSGPCCKLYRRNIICDNMLFFDCDLVWTEDTVFNIAFLGKAKTVYCSDRFMYHYRKENTSSASSVFHKDNYECYRDYYEKRRHIMRLTGCSNVSFVFLENAFFVNIIGTIREYQIYSSETTAQEKLSLLKKISNDEHIKSLKLRDVDSLQKKIMLILLRLKCHRLTWFLFDIYFKIRLRNKET